MDNNIWANGGFPNIKIHTENNEIKEKTKKEFSVKNIISIQNILDKRKNLLQFSRSTNNENYDKSSTIINTKRNDHNFLDFNIKTFDIPTIKRASKRASKKTSKKTSLIKNDN